MPKAKSKAKKSYPKLSTSTVATSTPIKDSVLNKFNISNNTELEGSGDEHLEPRELSTTIAESFVNMSLSSSGSIDDVELDETAKPRKTVANVGRDWNHFKPRDNTSLYKVVLTETGLTKDIANRWLDVWEKHSDVGMKFMLQFVLDVAGFQNYSISKLYGTREFHEKTILQELLENCPALLEDYTYLLRTHSEWSKKSKCMIFEFIEEIVLLVHERPHLQYNMLPELCKFLKIISSCDIRPLKHTGVVFALKLLMPLSKIHQAYQRRLSMHTKDTTVDMNFIKLLKSKEDIISRLMNDLLNIVLRNYGIQDSQLDGMRIECAQDLYKLIYRNPQFYFKQNAINIIVNLLVDENNKVRLAAINTFKKLLNLEKCYTYFKQIAAQIFKTVSRSLMDIDYNVAIKTVDSFTDALKLYRQELQQASITQVLLSMVYNKHYPLASAAGRFLYEFIKDDDIQNVIRAIIKFSRVPNADTRIPSLVESLIDCVPELQAFETISNMLLAEEISRNELHLMTIFCNSVMQTVTGKSSSIRIDSRQGEIDAKLVDTTMTIVWTKFVDLFKKHCNDTVCAHNLIKMLLVFSYQDPCAVQNRNAIIRILHVLGEYFINNNETETLHSISKLFSLLCDYYCPLRGPAKEILQKIIAESEETFKSIETDINWDTDAIEFLENLLLQLQALFRYHDTSIIWDFNFVPNLFPKLTKQNEKLFAYNLTCGLYYMKKMFHNAVQENTSNQSADEIRQNFANLKTKYVKFLDICFDYINNSAPPNVVVEQAFNCICDFLMSITTTIYDQKDTCRQVTYLTVKLSDEQKLLLEKFLKKFVFDLSASETVGEKHLSKCLSAIMTRALPISLLTNIFSYYNTFYAIYGLLFDDTLKHLITIDATVASAIIMSTLVKKYNILKLSNRRSLINTRSVDIKKLSLQFVRYLPVRFIVSTLKLGIIFAFTDEENLIFLLYIEDFFNNLPPGSKLYVYDYMIEIEAYERYQQNQYVVQVTKMLGNRKQKLDDSKKVPDGSEPSSSITTAENESQMSLDSDNAAPEIEEFDDE